MKYVDEFRAVHTLEALDDLCAALSSRRGARAADPRRFLDAVSLGKRAA